MVPCNSNNKETDNGYSILNISVNLIDNTQFGYVGNQYFHAEIVTYFLLDRII